MTELIWDGKYEACRVFKSLRAESPEVERASNSAKGDKDGKKE